MPLTDNKIRTFLSLADTRSYTQTAKKLGLTQPAVSHQIQQLEYEYGSKMFSRVKGKLKLTPQGEIIRRYALQVDSLSERAAMALGDSVSGVSRLSVGVTQTAGETFVPKILPLYLEQHPSARVTVTSDSLKKLCDRLLHYELDFAVVDGSPVIEELDTALLARDRVAAILPPDHPLASRDSITPDELRGERFITRPKKSGTRAIFSDYLASLGESEDMLTASVEIDSAYMIKRLVADGVGVSVMGMSACRREAESGLIAAVPFSGEGMTREISALCRRDYAGRNILGELISLYDSMPEE